METIRSNRFISFKLQADGENASIQSKIDALNVEGEFDLVNFFSRLENFLNDIEDYLLKRNDNNTDNAILNGSLLVKSEWMRNYARQQLAEFKFKEINSEKNQKLQHLLN